MSETKHTPGPWHTCGNGECTCGVVMADSHPVCNVVSGDWGDDFPSLRIVGGSLDARAEAYMEQITYGHIDREISKANARLIAAAPDLLAALHLVGMSAGWQHLAMETRAVIESAIAKAEGQ